MSETAKQVKKNPYPLVVKGVFYVTATFEDKQYVVSNGLSFIRFRKDNDGIEKGDYIEIHGPVYQRKDQANAIITGEAIVRKLDEKEVDEYKSKVTSCVKANSADKSKQDKQAPKKSSTKKSNSNQKMPWE